MAPPPPILYHGGGKKKRKQKFLIVFAQTPAALQLASQIPQLGIRVDAQRIPQVDVDAFLLEPFREFHDAVPKFP